MTTAAAAGYSGTPLAQKLGLRDGQRVLFIALPPDLEGLRSARRFAEVTEAGWDTLGAGAPGYDIIHGFASVRAVLQRHARRLLDLVARDGAIWVSWPKRASKVQTDISEDTIREVALPLGLVDVKVAAVSDVWSGLKLVVRKELR
ncbi:DUF3052 domain-containing protein [Devosia sp.]|uniref:DUF3052 domain-containing protein n=1 Tax=Devosia sp. TaxID=1871048 RepID=UPI002EE63661